MSSAKAWFEEFTQFAPQHTSIVYPLTVGLIGFIVVCVCGYLYNENKLKKKYHTDSPQREPEKVARTIILLMIAIFLSVSLTDITYTLTDWSKNKKWYVWKYKWFPQMLS